MNTRQTITGLATTIALLGTNLATMSATPSPRDWGIAICAAVAAGLMAAINPKEQLKTQFQKSKDTNK